MVFFLERNMFYPFYLRCNCFYCIIYIFFHFPLSLRRNWPLINLLQVLSTKFYKNGRLSWNSNTPHYENISDMQIWNIQNQNKNKTWNACNWYDSWISSQFAKITFATHCDVVYRKIILSWMNALQITNIDLFEEITTRFKLIFEESCLIILYIIYEENSGTRWWLLILE